MEYDRKQNTLDVSDCSFQDESTLDALHAILEPALANDKLRFFKILMSKDQFKWYKKYIDKNVKAGATQNPVGTALVYYKDKEVVEKP